NTVADAFPLAAQPDGQAEIFGEIGSIGDVDVFRFRPPTSGGYTIREQADNSFLDCLLTLFDHSGHVIFSNDRSEGPLNSRLDVTLSADQDYYIRAGAYFESEGSYRLSVTPVIDDFPSTLDTAKPLIFTNNQAVVLGNIETSGDVDTFQFTAQQTG